MSHTKTNSIDPRVGALRRAIPIALLLLLVAAPAHANRIVQVRVGNHPTFTRLVFELDAFAGYQVERAAASSGAEQLTVTLEASTPPREIHSKSVGIESVSIAEGVGQAIAQIRLRKSGLQMKEMILSNPPRVVLDFVHSADAVAELKRDPYAKSAPAESPTREEPAVAPPKPKPAPKPAAAPKPAPKPEPKPEPVVAEVVEQPAPPKLEPVAVPVEPTPPPQRKALADAAPKPAPKPKPKPEPAVAEVVAQKAPPELDPVAVPVEPTPPPQQVALLDTAPGEAPDASATDAGGAAELRDSIPGVHKRRKAKRPADEATADAPLGSREDAQSASERQQRRKQQQQRMPSPSDISRRIDTPEPADSGLPFGFGALTLAGIALAVIVALAVAVRLFRRRALPHDLDVTTLADEPDAGAAEDQPEMSDSIPAERVAMGAMGDLPDVEPAPPVEERETAAYSLSEVAAKQSEPEIGLYDEESEGEKPMDMDTTNLPTERDNIGMPPAAAMGGVDDNLSQLVQELASRVANLETRLDEANESRERLERQVAAQSEELRVQRAAIARTQRALRSLSRTEEDQATEPALREPSQPAG